MNSHKWNWIFGRSLEATSQHSVIKRRADLRELVCCLTLTVLSMLSHYLKPSQGTSKLCHQQERTALYLHALILFQGKAL